MSLATAIVHLRRQDRPLQESRVRGALRPLPGVRTFELSDADEIIAVLFDERTIGLADIVRSIEDCGGLVAGVSRRAISA